MWIDLGVKSIESNQKKKIINTFQQKDATDFPQSWTIDENQKQKRDRPSYRSNPHSSKSTSD